MNHRRARLDGVFRFKHGGQNLIFHVNQAQRGFGNRLAFGGDKRDAVADKPDFAVENHMIVGRRLRMALPRLRMPDFRQVFMRQHGMHAGQRARFARVNLDDAGMRVGAEQNFRAEHAGQVVIIGKFGFAGDELFGVHFRQRLIDDEQVVFALRRGGFADFAALIGQNRLNRLFIARIPIQRPNQRLADVGFGGVGMGV